MCNFRASRSRFPALCTACAWHTALPRDIQRPFLARSTEAPSSCSLTYITNARAPHDISCLCAVRMSTSTPQRQSEVALKEQTLKGKPRCPVKLSQLRFKASKNDTTGKYVISTTKGDVSCEAARWYREVTGDEWDGCPALFLQKRKKWLKDNYPTTAYARTRRKEENVQRRQEMQHVQECAMPHRTGPLEAAHVIMSMALARESGSQWR